MLCGLILESMNELDEHWADLLAHAHLNAAATGRGDVADYIALKAANDLLRSASVNWLFDSMTEIAGEAVRRGVPITIDRNELHRFEVGNSSMVGSRINFRCGIRCLSVEAGWTRTPADGFMRGGALAFSRLSHFGLPREQMEVILKRVGDSPVWTVRDGPMSGETLVMDILLAHFRILVS